MMWKKIAGGDNAHPIPAKNFRKRVAKRAAARHYRRMQKTSVSSALNLARAAIACVSVVVRSSIRPSIRWWVRASMLRDG